MISKYCKNVTLKHFFLYLWNEHECGLESKIYFFQIFYSFTLQKKQQIIRFDFMEKNGALTVVP